MDSKHPYGVREKILLEASRLFAQRGVESVAMREIAFEVGLSKPGLYYYFEDKETLVLAILVDMLKRVSEMVEQAARSTPDTRSRLTYLVNGFFSMSPEQRMMIRMASERFPTISVPARKAFNRGYQQNFVGKIEEILSDGIRRGELRKINAHRAVWVFLGMLYPFLSSETGETGDPQEELVTIFLKGVLKGSSTDDQ